MASTELQDTQSGDSPAKAEESQVEAQQSRHHMSDKGTGLAGVEVEPKPHSHQQGKQLTCHKVHLSRDTKMVFKKMIIIKYRPPSKKQRFHSYVKEIRKKGAVD